VALKAELATLMMDNVGVFRTEPLMRAAVAGVAEIKERYGRIRVRDVGKVYNTDLLEARELGYLIDNAEAMATSDRIAVLNRGRLVQFGAPAEIFDRPKTRFVAEFVGKANILSGRLDGAGHLILSDGVRIRLADAGDRLASSAASVCLRPHNIKLVTESNAVRELTEQGYNLFPGVIRRSIYFGDAVDYTVELLSGRVLRVVAPPSQRFDPGQSICAAAHPENCVIVRED